MTVDLTCVVSRLFEQVDTKLPDLAAGPMQRDVATYTDPQRFARELDRLFRQYPICVGYTAELPEPGDYKTIEVAGVSMIVVRGKDRQVRVLKNACLHRGAPLAEADHGRGLKRFRCPFHGWNYNDEGRLVAIPSRSCFPPLVADQRTLGQIPAREQAGLIFATIDGTEAPDVEDLLSRELANEIGGYQWDSMEMVSQETLPLRANWKQAVDSFGENYHVPFLHPTTIYPHTLPHTQVLDYFHQHVRMMFGMEGMREIRNQPDRWADAEVGPHLFPVYYLFPNLVLTIPTAGVLAAFQNFPGHNPGECTIVHTKLVDPALPPEQRAVVEAFVDFNWNDVVKPQDVPVIEAVWRSMESGACTAVIFGANEAPLQHFHREYDRLLDERVSPALG
jgi:phenylpropionate dioxygenase-like ring-hydroxylating dioxygenase large terminal subunit